MTNTTMKEQARTFKFLRGGESCVVWGSSCYVRATARRPQPKASLVMGKDIVRTRAYAACDELRTWKKMGSYNCAIAARRTIVSKLQLRLITTSTLYLSRWRAPRSGQTLIGPFTKALKWRLGHGSRFASSPVTTYFRDNRRAGGPLGREAVLCL